MNDRIELVELNQTCGACPSQWRGRDREGRHLYVRYRGGALSWGWGVTFDEAVDASMCRPALQIGGAFDGVMGTGEMLDLVGLEITEARSG